MRFTPPPRGPSIQGLDTRSLDQGIANVGNALAQRRQEIENKRRYDEQMALRKENALATRHMQNQRLKLAQQAASQGRVMNVGGRLLRVAPDGKHEVLYTPPQNTIDNQIKQAQLKKLQTPDPLKDIKARVLQQLLGPGQQQAPAQAEPRVQLQSGEITTTDPNLIQAQTAEQAPAAPQQPNALSNLTPEQRQAMALDLVSPGLGNSIRQGQKSEQLGKPAQNQLETKILNAEEHYSRIKDIGRQFDPEFLTFGGVAKGAWYRFRDKLNIGQLSLSPQQTEYLQRFSTFRQSSARNINLYIKEITGAQMSEKEADRIKLGEADAGTGFLDGDSPSQYKSKLENSMRLIRLSRMRYHYLRSGGFRGTVMSPEDIAKAMDSGRPPISLPQMRNIYNKRHSENLKRLRQQNPGASRQELDTQAIIQTDKELGI